MRVSNPAYLDGIGVLALEPGIAGESGDGSNGVRIEILLEETRLTRHREGNDFAPILVMQLVQASDFAGRHIESQFRHEGETTLWIGAVVATQVVYLFVLRRILEVPH